MNNKEHPWIPSREVSLCPWESYNVRGDYTNPHAALQPNIYRYSQRQMDAYMKMLVQMGYTGVQFIDSCYSWHLYGSAEAFHEVLIRMMLSARNAGLKTTLWVWAAFFSGHAWCDPEMIYTPSEGNTAFSDPAVRACFEKNYNLYAELAPYTDMLIGHYFDPGMLTSNDDIIAYFKLLAGKFRAVNPNVKLCVDTWGCPDGYPEALAASDLGQCLILEQPSPSAWPGDSRARFRRRLRENGFQVGMWGWYTCEYETDQMAAMYVNGHVLKDRYLAIRAEGDAILKPVYWSEMDAGHLYNLFSLYAAGQLLIDPERDPDELLWECVSAIWQDDIAEGMYDALKTIGDIRSGDCWETYWWTCEAFRWGTGDDVSDLVRVEEGIRWVERAAAQQDVESVRLSLPFAPWVLAKLILPHLEQMRLLLEFKKGMLALEKKREAGVSKDELYFELKKLLRPIPDFNTWVGNFLQIEQREQYRIVGEFCQQAGIPLPQSPERREALRTHALEKIAVHQRGHEDPFLFDSSVISEYYLAYSPEEALRLLDDLEHDGLIEYVGNGQYRMTHWQDQRFHFDVTRF